MSIAAAAAPLAEGAATSTGFFGRTANFLSGINSLNPSHMPVPVPKDAPTPATVAKSTINPDAVVA